MFLPSLFDKINDNIRYAVLRNYEKLPDSIGDSDLDILIHKDDYQSFIKCIHELNIEYDFDIVSVIEHPLCPHFCILGTNWGIQIDIFIGCIIHKNVVLYDWVFLSDYIVNYNQIKALNNDFANIIAFIKEVLNNKTCKDKYFEQAHHSIGQFSEIEKNKIFGIFDDENRKNIISYIESENFNKNDVKILAQRASSNLVSFCGKIKYKVGQFAKLKRVFKQTGYSIAFMGTDGSGKSTVINKIKPVLNSAFHNNVYYRHLRPSALPSLAVLFGKKAKHEVPVVNDNPHGGKPSGFLGSLFRLNYYLLDYTIGYFIKIFPKKSVKSCVWIFDRYYYDYLIDPKRNCIKLPKWIVKFYSNFVPTPDIIICLGSDAKIIRNRKPELPLFEVERQVSDLKEFAKKEKKAIWIDSGCSEDETVHRTMSAICDMMKKRGFVI